MEENEIKTFLDKQDYDLRKSHNGRWIDQKCTPDVLWSIADFIMNYIENVKKTFTVSDIWKSDYAKNTIAETYSKPGTDERTAENEYDKVFSQPLNLFCNAGIIEDIQPSKKHLYQVKNKEILEYISRNDLCSLKFLQLYIEKVLKDSDLYSNFNSFFEKQNKNSFNNLKTGFIDFYHEYTPIKKEYEPKRIFTKVLNPLAYKYQKRGAKHGNLSPDLIKRSDMMYNQDNFRDIYKDKPKNVTRQVWRQQHSNLRNGYFEQMLAHSKRIFKDYIQKYRKNISELSQFCNEYNDNEPATQIHHIFPKNEFPEIMHYLENLIAITPNQHFCFAHPNNQTSIISEEAQKSLLIAKTASIKHNLESNQEEHIYEFNKLLEVLNIGWDDPSILEISEYNYVDVVHAINCHYA